jgi:hypothetical protein
VVEVGDTMVIVEVNIEVEATVTGVNCVIVAVDET